MLSLICVSLIKMDAMIFGLLVLNISVIGVKLKVMTKRKVFLERMIEPVSVAFVLMTKEMLMLVPVTLVSMFGLEILAKLFIQSIAEALLEPLLGLMENYTLEIKLEKLLL